MAVEKTHGSRPLRKPSLQRPKPPSTFCLGSEKYMLAVFGAINLLLKRINAPRKRFSTGTFLSLGSLDSNFFNASRTPRPRTSLKEIIETIATLKEAVVIVALVGQDFQASPQPLGSIRPILLLRMTETATGHWSGKTKT